MNLRWLIPTLYIIFLMLPIYWLLNMSFKTTNEILAGFSPFPQDFTFENYAKIFDYVNSNPRLNAELKFGTLSEYFDAMKTEAGGEEG